MNKLNLYKLLFTAVIFYSTNLFSQHFSQRKYKSPIYLGILNKIILPEINDTEIELSSEDGFIQTTEKTGEYLFSIYMPDSVTLFGINKVTKDTSCAISFLVKRLPEKELKQPVITVGDIKGNQTTPSIF